MPLADRATLPDTRTKFERWLDGLDPRHRDTILGWLKHPGYSSTQISIWIREDDPEDGYTGYRAHKDTIAEWRRRNVSR